jgi:hypothetical protein
MTQQYFYDKQVRRYIQQFIRLFSGFSVQMGVGEDKLPMFLQVPVRYGDINRMAAHIQRENSENITNTVPFISCYVTDLSLAPERRVEQQHVDKVQVYEKKVNELGQYENEVGNTYTIERHMPVPYNLTMNCDVWTSNTHQKLQLLEQLLVLFNPTLDIKTSDNAFDWSSLSYVEMTNIIWSSRSVGNSVDDIIDVATLTFNIPIFVNPPAKVKHQRIIHTVLNQLYNLDDNNLDDFKEGLPFDQSTLEYTIVTLEGRKLEYIDGKATLLAHSGSNINPETGTILEWKEHLKPFGELREGISQLRLKKNKDPDSLDGDIIGRLAYDDNNPNKLIVDIDADTLPANTLAPLNGIVNPVINFPGDGTLPDAELGQRYLLTHANIKQWGSVEGNAHDIIEYNGSDWVLSFTSSTQADTSHFVLNLLTQDQFEWNGVEWVNSYEGIYNEGFWRLYL